MKAIILSGGLGTRLRERVPNLPKPMAPVAGHPFLEYILHRLVSGGIDEIILSVGYRSDTIIAHFGHSYRNVRLIYSFENEPLGTGGAILQAVRDIDDQTFLIINGDTFVNISFDKLLSWYYMQNSSVAMVLKEVEDVSRYGSVVVSDDIVSGFVEKGSTGSGLINAGLYFIHTSALKKYNLPAKFSLENDFLQAYFHDLQPRTFITNEYFIDIGIPSDYERAQHELPIFIPLN